MKLFWKWTICITSENNRQENRDSQCNWNNFVIWLKCKYKKLIQKLVPNTSILITNCQYAFVDQENEEKKNNPVVIWILDLRKLTCT